MAADPARSWSGRLEIKHVKCQIPAIPIATFGIIEVSDGNSEKIGKSVTGGNSSPTCCTKCTDYMLHHFVHVPLP